MQKLGLHPIDFWTLRSFSRRARYCLCTLPNVVHCAMTSFLLWYKSKCPFPYLVKLLFGSYILHFYPSIKWLRRIWKMFSFQQLFADIAVETLHPWVNSSAVVLWWFEFRSGYICYFSSRFCFKTFILLLLECQVSAHIKITLPRLSANNF